MWTEAQKLLGVPLQQGSSANSREKSSVVNFPKERPEPNAPTFLSAALAYMQAGRSRRGLAALIDHFGETPLVEINQQAIDAAAIAIKPDVTPATRNTYVYTPISAVMHYALGDDAPKIRRPKGAKGRIVTDFLSPADASAIIAAAEAIDLEFALLIAVSTLQRRQAW